MGENAKTDTTDKNQITDKTDSPKETEWQEVHILEDLICMKIPADWVKPPEEWIRKRFSSKRPPQEIFMTPTGECILTCNLLKKRLEEKQVETALMEIQKQIEHVYPESIRERVSTFKTVSGVGKCFSFVTGGINGDSYHYMFLVSVNGNMMFGSCHFPAERVHGEKQVFREIGRSMEVIKKEKEKKMGYGRSIW